jgi:hypothetical protein
MAVPVIKRYLMGIKKKSNMRTASSINHRSKRKKRIISRSIDILHWSRLGNLGRMSSGDNDIMLIISEHVTSDY